MPKFNYTLAVLSPRSFDSSSAISYRKTRTPKEIIEKALAFSDELSYYYELYQLLLFHFQEKNRDHFFSLIQEHKHYVSPAFKKVFQTFIRYKDYITNALEMPYSNARLEATNKLIKDIKRQAFGFRNFDNFKTKNTYHFEYQEREDLSPLSHVIISQPTTVDKEPKSHSDSLTSIIFKVGITVRFYFEASFCLASLLE